MTLAEYIEKNLTNKFEWGVHDCMTFTIGWVENVTGKKYLPSEMWKNEKQARQRVKKEGGLEKVFDDNFYSIEVNMATDGDITVINNVASIFSGRYVLSTGIDGIIKKSRSEAKKAWKIK
jgi:hypothetical protein